MKALAAGAARRLAVAAALAAIAVFRAPALDLGIDLGAGAKLDVAGFGIENVTVLATAAPWIGLGGPFQVGIVSAASAGSSKADFELSACLRLQPAEAIAVFGGAGILASVGDGPPLVPLALGGLRLGLGRLGFLACAEIHVKPDDTDTMIWMAAVYKIL